MISDALQEWNPPAKLTITTVGNISIWPHSSYIPYYAPPQWSVTIPPRVCSGEVHVFPCPHCEKCKCGAATLKQQHKDKKS